MTLRQKSSSGKLTLNEEGSYTVFKDIVNTIKQFLDEMKMRLDQITQETGYIVSLAENHDTFVKQYPELVPRIKENIRTYSGMALSATSLPENYFLLANSIDLLINKLLRKLEKSIKDSGYLYFILDEYVNNEKTRVENLVRERLQGSNENLSELVWDEDPIKPTRKKSSVISDPQIFFTDKIESNSNVFQPQIKECLVSSMDRQFKCVKDSKHIIDHFNCLAQILANFNNMKKSTLYIKLSFESTYKVLHIILEQIRVKHFFYQCSAKEYSKFKRNLWDESKYLQSFDKICVSASQIELEVKKLTNQLSVLVLQVTSTQKTCIPLLNLFSSGVNVEKFKKVTKKGNDITNLIEGLFENKQELSIRENRSFSILPVKTKTMEDIEVSRFNKQARYKSSLKFRPKEIKKTPEYQQRIDHLMTYQIIHLKSVLLKKLQPQRIITEIMRTRENLSETMLKFCQTDVKLKAEWETKIKLLSTKMFNLRYMENKVKFSYTLNQYGCHSYNSSWDLEQVERQNTASHTVESQASGSESLSEQSESELSEAGDLQKLDNKNRATDWKDRIYSKMNYRFSKPPSQFSLSTFDTAMNSLNKASKEIHSTGLYGWKNELKKLRHKEDKLKIRSHKAKVLSKVNSEHYNLRVDTPSPISFISRGFSPSHVYIPPLKTPSPINKTSRYQADINTIPANLGGKILFNPNIKDKDTYMIFKSKPLENVISPSETHLYKTRASTVYSKGSSAGNIIPKKTIGKFMPKVSYSEYDIIEKIKQYNLKSNLESSLKGVLDTLPASKSPLRDNSRKLSQQIEKQLNQLSPYRDSKKKLEQRTILALSKYSSGLLRHRINIIRKDSSLDPLKKISKVREEFDCDNRGRTVKKGSTTSNRGWRGN